VIPTTGHKPVLGLEHADARGAAVEVTVKAFGLSTLDDVHDYRTALGKALLTIPQPGYLPSSPDLGSLEAATRLTLEAWLARTTLGARGRSWAGGRRARRSRADHLRGSRPQQGERRGALRRPFGPRPNRRLDRPQWQETSAASQVLPGLNQRRSRFEVVRILGRETRPAEPTVCVEDAGDEMEAQWDLVVRAAQTKRLTPKSAPMMRVPMISINITTAPLHGTRGEQLRPSQRPDVPRDAVRGRNRGFCDHGAVHGTGSYANPGPNLVDRSHRFMS
jgi:hypothetical protein